jgi:Kef-type K+ transport system membrane component KefB
LETPFPEPEDPDARYIIIIALFALASSFIIHSQQHKRPKWKIPADILLGTGIALTIIGMLCQSYLISVRSGQHLTSVLSVAGVIGIILMISVLVVRNRQNNQKEGDEKIVWIYVIWFVTALLSLVLGVCTGA